MATTLVQFWQEERDTYETQQAAAQNDLGTAQLALTNAKAALVSDQASFAKQAADIAASRAQLASTSVPSEVSALNDKIRDGIVAQRGLQGALLDDQSAIDQAQEQVDASGAILVRTTASLADAEAKLDKAKDERKKREMMKTTLEIAPLDTLPKDAADFHDGDTTTRATARISKNFPPELLSIVEKRYTSWTSRVTKLTKELTDAEDALADEYAAAGGLDGAARKTEIEFRKAEGELADYFATARVGFERAREVMNQLEAITLADGKVPDILTDREQKDAASNPARTAVSPDVKAVVDKRDAYFEALDKVDVAVLALIKADFTAPARDAVIQTKRDAATAWQTVKNTEKDFNKDEKTTLGQWEAVIPDAAWTVLLQYKDALAELDRLKGSNPAGLIKTLTDTEGAYAAALAAAAKAQRHIAALGDAVALRQERLDDYITALPSRLFSAVRGNSF